MTPMPYDLQGELLPVVAVSTALQAIIPIVKRFKHAVILQSNSAKYYFASTEDEMVFKKKRRKLRLIS